LGAKLLIDILEISVGLEEDHASQFLLLIIGKLAGDSLSRGLIAFLGMMAMLSVGLGILNILPIPVLDGGHLLLLSIEAIRGKPLSLRQMEIIQQVGLSLILLLMVVVMKNDIARLIN